MKKMLIVALFSLTHAAYCTEDHSKELEELNSGKRTEAYARWWNPGKDNATTALQSAINSGAKQVIVDNIGHDWIVDPILLTDNQEIVIGKDVTITARKDSFKGLRDSLFSAIGKKNIKIRGMGNSVLQMNKTDYQDPAQYKPGEWRHTMNLLSCENVEISNLTLKSSGGDGIYIGVNYGDANAQKYCKNITIDNVICDNHHRQGISVISAENLLIRKSVFKNTSGAPPMDGIDFEPNAASERLVNCTIEDCEFSNNASVGIELYHVNLTKASEPLSIYVKKTSIRGNMTGTIINSVNKINNQPVCGTVTFEDCLIENSSSPALIIKNQPEGSLKTIFRNCTINTLKTNSGNAPVLLIADTVKTLDGIQFENLSLINNSSKEVLSYKTWTDCSLKNICGNLRILRNGNVEEINVADIVKKLENQKESPKTCPSAAKLQLAKISRPSIVPANITEAPKFFLRRKATLLLWGEKGAMVSTGITFAKIGPSAPDSGAIKIKSPSGKLLKKMQMPYDGKEYRCEFKADEEGIFQIEAYPGMESAAFSPGKQAYGFYVEEEGSDIMKPHGRLYFEVPAGVKNFRVDVYGYLRETVTAAILDKDMQIIQKKDNIETPHSFEISRENAMDSEIWAIEFSNAVEDVFIKLYTPLAPIVSNSKEGLLLSR